MNRDNIKLSSLGLIVQNAIKEIPFHHKDVQVLTNVIMPNHLHMLLKIDPADLLKTSTTLSKSFWVSNRTCPKPL